MKKLLYLFMLLGLSARAQENPANGKLRDIAVSLDNFAGKVAIEKVHVHFDKPYYSLGDTIWIKAYAVNQTNGLSPLSKFLYADLLNDKDSVKTSLRLPLTNGLGWGSITLSDSLLKAGNYHIRAYTNLMRNFGEEYYFDRAVKIGNALPPVTTGKGILPTLKTKTTTKNDLLVNPVKNDPENISIQFFPEGGELVNELISKVAFKAVGADGLGREISGYIVDKDNQQVTAFQSEHAGMGTFVFQPTAGNRYTAVIKLNDGIEKRVDLPQAKDKGYAIILRQTEDNIIVNIQASKALLNTGEIALVAQANNTIQYTGKAELTRTGFTTIIPKNRFPEGVLQFTLFSPDYQPVAERLVFIRNTDKHLNIKFTTDKPEYKQRKRVHLNLEVTGQDGKPVTGTFSLAVTDEGKVPYAEGDEKTIFSNLLLTADLKGYIEQPNYYFTDINADKDKQLDNLLLTQGWRRFVWNEVLTNTYPPVTFQPEKGRGVSGRVITDKGKPVAGAKVTLLVNVGGGAILDTVANADGRFSFDFPFRAGTTYNVAAIDPKKNTDLKVEIDKQQVIGLVSLSHLPPEQSLNDDFTIYLDNSKKRFDEMKRYGLLNNSILLKEVKINDYVKKMDLKAIATQHSSNLAGELGTTKTFTFVDIAPYVDHVKAYLKAMAPQRFNKGRYVVVDGVGGRPMPDGNDIECIEIVDGAAAALWGFKGSNGVIIFTTKRGGIDYNGLIEEYYHPGSTKSKGLKSYTFQGSYDLRKEFYAPDYDNPKTATQMADLRSTIYWKPNIITDENGKASVDFFNADGTGSYRVIAEGLDGMGKLGRQVFKYVVK